jgi:hypothetical protein
VVLRRHPPSASSSRSSSFSVNPVTSLRATSPPHRIGHDDPFQRTFASEHRRIASIVRSFSVGVVPDENMIVLALRIRPSIRSSSSSSNAAALVMVRSPTSWNADSHSSRARSCEIPI